MESMESFSALYWQTNKYVANCTGLSIDRDSCEISGIETAKRDFVAFLRLIFAMLSILGTLSILISVVRRKQILNPKIHAIFMLSIADFFLAVMWVVGSILWMSGGIYGNDRNRVGCFTVNLITVILECVSTNLTCMYALMAYSGIKKKDFSNVYSLFDKDLDSQVWKPWKTILAYVLSWVLPVLLIMLPFSIVAGAFDLVHEASKCSCWCLPYFGNVVPSASPRDNNTAYYMHHLSMFVASYAVIVGVHYLVGFILLVTVYCKILRLIKRLKTNHLRTEVHKTYGVTSNVIAKGQSRAKQRVIYFLTVFVLTGFFNLLLCFFFIIYEGDLLYNLPHAWDKEVQIPFSILFLYTSQSITVPLQGFLNAIVYGWTREDFVQAVRSDSVNVQNQDDRLYREQGGSLASSATHMLSSTRTERGDGLYNRSYATSTQGDLLFSIPEQDQFS